VDAGGAQPPVALLLEAVLAVAHAPKGGHICKYFLPGMIIPGMLPGIYIII
jgi:hypothetical protein